MWLASLESARSHWRDILHEVFRAGDPATAEFVSNDAGYAVTLGALSDDLFRPAQACRALVDKYVWFPFGGRSEPMFECAAYNNKYAVQCYASFSEKFVGLFSIDTLKACAAIDSERSVQCVVDLLQKQRIFLGAGESIKDCIGL